MNKKNVKKIVKPIKNKTDKFDLEFDEDFEDLGGSGEVIPVKNLKVVVSNDKFLILQDGTWTYTLNGSILRKVGIRED